MNLTAKYWHFKILAVILFLLRFNNGIFAVTDYNKATIPYIYDLSKIKSSLSLPVTDKEVMVKIPKDKLKYRAIKSEADDRVEPIVLSLPTNRIELTNVVEKLAKGKEPDKLYEYFVKHIPKKSKSDKFKVKLEKSKIRLVDLDALVDYLAKPHREVEIISTQLKDDHKLTDEFINQLKLFVPKEELRRIELKIKQSENLSLEQDILPEFARKMARKYLVYRGPNCFHAALAFHSQNITKSPYINVKEEQGYHRSMINYDELWRYLKANFYEVNLETSALKYGDMILFLDVPDNEQPLYFRWIRHTSTYLFGPYTFSKGSKSPNTPYTVKTLLDEWHTWKKYSKNLSIKVFRRAKKSLKNNPSQDLRDWLF